MKDSGSYYPPGVKDNPPPSSSTVPIGLLVVLEGGGASRRERARKAGTRKSDVRTAQKGLPVVPKRGV